MGEKTDNYLAAVLTAFIRFIFCLLSCALLLRMGRRSLGILSATGTAVASLVLAGYTLAKKGDSYLDVSISHHLYSISALETYRRHTNQIRTSFLNIVFVRIVAELRNRHLYSYVRECEHCGSDDTSGVDDGRAFASTSPRYRRRLHILRL